MILKEFILIETLIVGASTSLPAYGSAHKLNYFREWGGNQNSTSRAHLENGIGKWDLDLKTSNFLKDIRC